ncbi:MAG: hypothetical protein AAFX92_14375 [Pseudomonadota bacterium]
MSWDPQAIDEFLLPGVGFLAAVVLILWLARQLIARRFDGLRVLMTAGLVVSSISLVIYVAGFVVVALFLVIY